MFTTLRASAHNIPLPDESVHLIVSSPPYYALRSYSGEQMVEFPTVCYSPMAGIPAIEVQGCDPDCNHLWGEAKVIHQRGVSVGSTLDSNQNRGRQEKTSNGQHCQLCGGWRGGLGQEPDVSAYIGHLMLCLRNWHRILRSDGCAFINLGDSYSGSGGSGGDYGPGGLKEGQPKTKGAKANGIPAKNLLLVPERFRLAAQADGWIVRSAFPWIKRNCLSGGTIVYARTQKGDSPMTIKDLARLRPDTVKLWNGTKWTQVLDIWEHDQDRGEVSKQNGIAKSRKHRGENEFEYGSIEIELRNGQRIGCTPEHRWPTLRGLLCANQLTVGDVIETCTLPEPDIPSKPIGLPDEDIGWFIGMYLAEGCLDKTGRMIHISGHAKETERFIRLQRIARAYDATCNMYCYGNRATVNIASKILTGVIRTYIIGDDALTKHLDTPCWRRSNAFLKALLEGYLEGDGHHDTENNRWRLGFCNNDYLAADLRTMGGRLGIGIRLKRYKMPSSDGKMFPGWRGEIRLGNKIGKAGHVFQSKPNGEIVAIRASRARKFWDIAVEDEPHLFALASGVLTHNSLPESCLDRPSNSAESWVMLAKSPRYYWDAEAIKAESVKFAQEGERPRTRKNGLRNDEDKMLGGSQCQVTATRNRRTGDWMFETLDAAIADTRAWLAHAEQVKANQGLLLDTDGDPLAMLVNPRPFSGAHFAAFPQGVVEPLILGGTSQRGCCSKCGAPHKRIVESKPALAEDGKTCLKCGKNHGRPKGKTHDAKTGAQDSHMADYLSNDVFVCVERTTTGWEPSCTCDAGDPVPCTVLDPFVGSGTTLEVATSLGRHSIGVDISQEYLDNVLPTRFTDGVQIGMQF